MPTGNELVSNIAQSDGGHGSLVVYDQAQVFTTGSNSTGYTLASVEIDMLTEGEIATVFTVSIHSNSGGAPGTSLGTLTNPASVAATGVHVFTTSGFALEASTTYFVVIDRVSATSAPSSPNLRVSAVLFGPWTSLLLLVWGLPHGVVAPRQEPKIPRSYTRIFRLDGALASPTCPSSTRPRTTRMRLRRLTGGSATVACTAAGIRAVPGRPLPSPRRFGSGVPPSPGPPSLRTGA